MASALLSWVLYYNLWWMVFSNYIYLWSNLLQQNWVLLLFFENLILVVFVFMWSILSVIYQLFTSHIFSGYCPCLSSAYRLDSRMLRRKFYNFKVKMKRFFEFIRPAKKHFVLESDKERFAKEDILSRLSQLQPLLNFTRGHWRMKLMLLSAENSLLTTVGDAFFASATSAEWWWGFKYYPAFYFATSMLVSYFEFRKDTAMVLALDGLTYSQLPKQTVKNFNKGKSMFAVVYAGVFAWYLSRPDVCGADAQTCYYHTYHIGFSYAGCWMPCSENVYADAQSAFWDTYVCLKEPLPLDVWLKEQIGVMTADQINKVLGGCTRHFYEDSFGDVFCIPAGVVGLMLLYACWNQTVHMFAPWWMPSHALRLGYYFMTSTDQIEVLEGIFEVTVRAFFWAGLGLTGGSAVILGIKALILVHEYRYGNLVLDRYNQQPEMSIAFLEFGDMK